MNNRFLHNIISFFVILGTYMMMSILITPRQDMLIAMAAENLLNKVVLVLLVSVALFVVPTLIYTKCKQLLLPQLKRKEPKFKPFFILNLKLVGLFVVWFTIYNLVGSGLKEPTDLVTSIIVLLFGVLGVIILCHWLLYVQYVHKSDFGKAADLTLKHWKLAWKLVFITLGVALFIYGSGLLGNLIMVTYWMQYGIFIASILLFVYGYTWWQEQVFL